MASKDLTIAVSTAIGFTYGTCQIDKQAASRPLTLGSELLSKTGAGFTIPPIIHYLLRRGPLRIVHPGLASPFDASYEYPSDVLLLKTGGFVESSGMDLEFGYL